MLLVLLLIAGCTSRAEKAAEQAAIAQQLLDAGNLPVARTFVTQALAYGGDNPEILLLDARIKARMSDLRGAYEAYRTLLVFQPENIEALSAVAQFGVVLGEKDVARNAITRALALEPYNAEILLTSGVMALQDDDFPLALRVADQILAAGSGDARGLALKARALSQTGRGAEALAMLRDEIARTGNNPLIAGAVLETARALGNSQVMLEQFPLLAESRPESFELLLDEINTRYKSGDVEGARAASRDFIAKFGARSEVMARLLDLWEEFDREPLAPADIDALASSGAIEARLAVARFYFGRGNLGAAQTLVANSPDLRAAGMRARILIRRGDPGGVAAAGRVIGADDTNCEALTAMAEWNIGQNKIDAAVLAAQVAATQCRDRIDGYMLLASAYERAGRPAAVERAMRDGIDAHPIDPRLTERFADWLLRQDRAETALSVARRLTTVAPSRASSWRVLAATCRRAKDATCSRDAARGLERAKATYQLDPLPGVRPVDPLYGRSWR